MLRTIFESAIINKVLIIFQMSEREKMREIHLKKYKECWIQLIIILVCIIPIIITCFYIVPAADDFGNALNMRGLLLEHNSYFTAALAGTKELYKETSGYFFAAFLNLFFSPFLRWGEMGIQVFCIVVNLLLYITLYFLIKMIMNYWLKVSDIYTVLWVYVLLLICFTNIFLNREATFWYCVVVAYVLVLVTMLWGDIMFMKALAFQQKKYYIIAAILGFFASGGSLNVTALNCFIYLLIAIYGYIEMKQKKSTVIVFGCALLGGIINLLSPGNYARHGSISDDFGVIPAIISSIKLVVVRFYELFSNTLFPLLLIVLLLILLNTPGKIKTYKYLHPIVLCIGLAGTLSVLAFPVYLGYGTETGFPKRCYFVQDMALYLFSFIIVIYFASWLKERYGKFRFNKEHIVTVTLLCFLSFCMWHSGRLLFDAYPSFVLSKQVLNGENQRFQWYWQAVLKEIEEGEGAVVVVKDELENTSPLIGVGINDDEEYWVNQVVAGYYGKSSVRLVSEEKDEK